MPQIIYGQGICFNFGNTLVFLLVPKPGPPANGADTVTPPQGPGVAREDLGQVDSPFGDISS